MAHCSASNDRPARGPIAVQDALAAGPAQGGVRPADDTLDGFSTRILASAEHARWGPAFAVGGPQLLKSAIHGNANGEGRQQVAGDSAAVSGQG